MPNLNVFATLARHPRLLRHWLPFARKVLNGSSLPVRQRELVVLRVAWRCRAAYEWAQHVPMARDGGCTDDEIRRLTEPGTSGWDEPDAWLLQAVDDLVNDHCISDAAWEGLTASFNQQQVIEVPALAGNYIMLAGMLNSFGVQPETDDMAALGQT